MISLYSNFNELEPNVFIKRFYQRPSRKLFFPAGMLSLCLLPLMAFPLLLSDPFFNEDHCIKINYTSRTGILLWGNFYERIDTSFSIDGTEEKRRKTFTGICTEIERLSVQEKDHVVQILFMNASTWNDYIRLLDFFARKSIRLYAVDSNAVWVHTNEKKAMERGKIRRDSLVRDAIRRDSIASAHGNSTH